MLYLTQILENYHYVGTTLVFFGVYLAKKKNVKKSLEKNIANIFSIIFSIFNFACIYLFLSKKFTISSQ